MTIVNVLYARLRTGERVTGVVGHRGARATHPENTLQAFRHAIDCGADAIELDIVVTRDQQLAVTHDPVNATFEDLPASIPLLEGALAMGRGNDVVFDIEMKECGTLTPSPADYAKLLLSRLDGRELDDRIMVRSFRHDFLRAIRELRPELPTVALVDKDCGDWVRVCRAAGVSAISPRFEHVSAEVIAHAHEAGIAVIPWTVNDPVDWSRLIAVQVDAIITDNPAALVRFLK